MKTWRQTETLQHLNCARTLLKLLCIKHIEFLNNFHILEIIESYSLNWFVLLTPLIVYQVFNQTYFFVIYFLEVSCFCAWAYEISCLCAWVYEVSCLCAWAFVIWLILVKISLEVQGGLDYFQIVEGTRCLPWFSVNIRWFTNWLLAR